MDVGAVSETGFFFFLFFLLHAVFLRLPILGAKSTTYFLPRLHSEQDSLSVALSQPTSSQKSKNGETTSQVIRCKLGSGQFHRQGGQKVLGVTTNNKSRDQEVFQLASTQCSDIYAVKEAGRAKIAHANALKQRKEQSTQKCLFVHISESGSLSQPRNEVPKPLAQAGVSLDVWMLIYDQCQQELKPCVMKTRNMSTKCHTQIANYVGNQVARQQGPLGMAESGHEKKTFKMVMGLGAAYHQTTFLATNIVPQMGPLLPSNVVVKLNSESNRPWPNDAKGCLQDADFVLACGIVFLVLPTVTPMAPACPPVAPTTTVLEC